MRQILYNSLFFDANLVAFKMSETSADLDSIFVEIGELGRHQIITFVLLSALNFLNGVSIVNFMISASTLDYR